MSSALLGFGDLRLHINRWPPATTATPARLRIEASDRQAASAESASPIGAAFVTRPTLRLEIDRGIAVRGLDASMAPANG